MSIPIERFDVFMVSVTSLDSTEIRRPEPCVVISPNELNNQLKTVTVAPVRHIGRAAPFRVPINIEYGQYQLALDQMRTIDKKRLLNKVTTLNQIKAQEICDIMQNMFAFN